MMRTIVGWSVAANITFSTVPPTVRSLSSSTIRPSRTAATASVAPASHSFGLISCDVKSAVWSSIRMSREARGDRRWRPAMISAMSTGPRSRERASAARGPVPPEGEGVWRAVQTDCFRRSAARRTTHSRQAPTLQANADGSVTLKLELARKEKNLRKHHRLRVYSSLRAVRRFPRVCA